LSDRGALAGVLAHAGRVHAPRGKDPVELACVAMWTAIRADIVAVASVVSVASGSKARFGAAESVEARGMRKAVEALRACAPLWPDGAPTWAARS
jgi:hypothetical protein